MPKKKKQTSDLSSYLLKRLEEYKLTPPLRSIRSLSSI